MKPNLKASTIRALDVDPNTLVSLSLSLSLSLSFSLQIQTCIFHLKFEGVRGSVADKATSKLDTHTHTHNKNILNMCVTTVLCRVLTRTCKHDM